MTLPIRGLFVIALLGCGAHAPPAAPAPVAAPVSKNPLYAQFLGAWTGQLEYRDFQSDEQVFLPTWLTIRESPDARSLQLDLVYDDGPTKIVRERMLIAIDGGNAVAEIGSDRDKQHDRYQVEGIEKFKAKGRGTLLLTGTSQENDKPVEVRIKLGLGRNLFTLRKDTRPAGAEFRFRDGYTFTRAQPPAAAAAP